MRPWPWWRRPVEVRTAPPRPAVPDVRVDRRTEEQRAADQARLADAWGLR